MKSPTFRRCTRGGCGKRLQPKAKRCVCGYTAWTWAFVADLGAGPDGKRRQRRGQGYETQAEAEAARLKIVGEVLTGTYREPSAMTVGEWLRAWLDGRTGKPTTVAQHRQNIECYLAPVADRAEGRVHLGAVPLARLEPEQVDTFYRWLEREGRCKRAGGLAPKSVRLIHGTLHAALETAVERGHVARNVAALANPPSQKQARSRRAQKAWTAEQLRAFLAHAGERGERLHPALHLAATTGMRRGEVLALPLSALDLDGGRLRVVQSVTVAEGRLVWDESAKTDAGERMIELDSGTVAVLRTWLEVRELERMVVGAAWTDEDGSLAGPLVFCDEIGRVVDPDRFYRLVVRLAKALDLPVLDAHGIRHSYATAALRAGVPVDVLSKRLGHADPAVTLKVYAHVLGGDDKAAAQRAAAAILGDV
jgi:integrase